MSEAFYQHLFPSRFRVLGRWLPPLSLWHLAALEAVGSPFADRASKVDFADIQIAVKICRTRWPHQPAPKPSIRDWWTAYRLRNNKRAISEQGRVMFAHIKAYSVMPRLWESVDDSQNNITAPPIMSRVAGLSRLGCFSLSEIWNDITPSFSVWLLLSIAEREGAGVQFWKPGDDDDIPQVPQPKNEAEARALAKSLGMAGSALERFIDGARAKWKEARHGR